MMHSKYWFSRVIVVSLVVATVGYMPAPAGADPRRGNDWRPACEDLKTTISCLAQGLKFIGKAAAELKPLASAAGALDMMMNAESCSKLLDYSPVKICSSISDYGKLRVDKDTMYQNLWGCGMNMCGLNAACNTGNWTKIMSKASGDTGIVKNNCNSAMLEIKNAMVGSWKIPKGQSCFVDASGKEDSDTWELPRLTAAGGKCANYKRCCEQFKGDDNNTYYRCKEQLQYSGWKCIGKNGKNIDRNWGN